MYKYLFEHIYGQLIEEPPNCFPQQLHHLYLSWYSISPIKNKFLFFQISHVLIFLCLCKHPSFMPTQRLEETFAMKNLHGVPKPSIPTNDHPESCIPPTLQSLPPKKENCQLLLPLTYLDIWMRKGRSCPSDLEGEHVSNWEGWW